MILCLVSLSPEISAQRSFEDGHWKAVILYNNTPYLVNMNSNGGIVRFVKELPSDTKALQDFIDTEFKDAVSVAMIEEASNYSPAVSFVTRDFGPETETGGAEETNFEVIAQEPMDEVVESISDDVITEQVNAEVSEIITETDEIEDLVEDTEEETSSPTDIDREEYLYTLVYPGQVAVFNQGQLSRLDEIIKVLNENPDLRFSMHAFASDMDKVSETVNRNRLKGIGDYLQVKGIAEDRIESKGITIDPEKSNTIRIILY